MERSVPDNGFLMGFLGYYSLLVPIIYFWLLLYTDGSY